MGLSGAAWQDRAKFCSTDFLVLQNMIRCDGLETFVENSDQVFHWFPAAALPEAGSGSPKDDCLRRYTRRCVRFASQKIRDLALMLLDLSKLADVALACLDDSKASTGYWLELLACRFLQVKLTSSCPCYCPVVIGCCVCDKALGCMMRWEGCVIINQQNPVGYPILGYLFHV